jgi:hypothetical protein
VRRASQPGWSGIVVVVMDDLEADPVRRLHDRRGLGLDRLIGGVEEGFLDVGQSVITCREVLMDAERARIPLSDSEAEFGCE